MKREFGVEVSFFCFFFNDKDIFIKKIKKV